jgi:mevalonate kinase
LHTGSAPGKVILCGEHAVVYGIPAIALPVTAVKAYAALEETEDEGLVVEAVDLDQSWHIDEQPEHPLASLARATLALAPAPPSLKLKVTLRSTIPMASGMGSGAALSAAFARALAGYLQLSLDPVTVSQLVYEAERHYHGTPSGIDNTVVSFEQPIVFQRKDHGVPPLMEPLAIRGVLTLVIADTGVRCPTRVTVGAVRERWLADPEGYDRLFTAIGDVVCGVRAALQDGDMRRTGKLLDENQRLLEAIGVSTPELETLIAVARRAGAWGAKLSGGGGGGIMLALVSPDRAQRVVQALGEAGAARVILTRLPA